MNRAPEPTEYDVARASGAAAQEVFDGSDGRLTVAYYRRLQELGTVGIVAMNLFRAAKTSSRAKVYRGRQYRGASYDVKNYSLQCLTTALKDCPEIQWGWKEDPKSVNFEWVLYVALPQGQASFHASSRGSGPDFPGEWDGEHKSQERILQFCDELLRSRSYSTAS